jgi:endogenous inhibitor of DNA gyrase (YacG/DUF329 family)
MVEPVAFKARRPCPICKKPSQVKFHPFCSNRCAQVDLGRWLNGSYAVPVVEDDDRPDDGGDET